MEAERRQTARLVADSVLAELRKTSKCDASMSAKAGCGSESDTAQSSGCGCSRVCPAEPDGLVNKVVPAARLDAETKGLAGKIAEFSRLILSMENALFILRSIFLTTKLMPMAAK